MIKHPSLIGKERAFRLIFWQSLSVCLVSGVVFISLGGSQALLLLLGGAIAIIPNTIFAAMTFRSAGRQRPDVMVQAFYRGVAIKLMLTVLLFALTFALLKPQGVTIFLGFMAAQLAHWLAPLLFQPKQLG